MNPATTAMTPPPVEKTAEPDTFDKSIVTQLKDAADRCKQEKKDHLINEWATNVDYRRGKPFNVTSDQDRVNVNIDWSLTKNKFVQLASNIPQVYCKAKRDQFKNAVAKQQKQLNDALKRARMGTAVNEATIDAINAAGIGVVFCAFKKITEKVMLPKIDPATLPPEQQTMMLQQPPDQAQAEMVEQERTVDTQIVVRRISPADALWPLEFAGSDFDDADWVGYTGRMTWAEAKRQFNLSDEDKQKIVTTRQANESIRQDDEINATTSDPIVEYDEIYYWAHRYDTNCKYFQQINRLLIISGLDDPIYNGPWEGQQFDETTGSYTGSCKRPVRFLTLTYVSDDAIPPSDSAIGRPQVKEIIRGRTQIFEQRERSKPLRWYDVNRVDPMVGDTLMRGTWQGMIPVQGAGDKVIGEVARSNYPREEFDFDRVAKTDLTEQWSLGPNQMGTFAPGSQSAHEASIVNENAQTRIGYERSRVSDLIVGIAEVVAGFISLFDDYDVLSDEERQQLEETWDRTHIANEFTYFIWPDSTVLLDANQRIGKLEKLLNLVGKSGYINPKPIIEELVILHGVDPTEVIVDPQPTEPSQPNISYRFSGDDLTNPMAIAMLVQSGQAPSPEDMQAAKKMLQEAYGLNMPPEMAQTLSGPATQGPPTGPGQPTQPPADSRPHWTPMPRVTKRVDEMGG